MTAVDLARQLVDTLNRHGAFTARVAGTRVVVRHLDSGAHAATVWPPQYDGDFFEWFFAEPRPAGRGPRRMHGTATIEEVVRAVATSVLDEAEVWS